VVQPQPDAGTDAGAAGCEAPRINCSSGDGPADCVDTSNDDENCGACGHACGSNYKCKGGQCVFDCAPPTAACGDDAGNNRCVDLSNDDSHCGACGHACAASTKCVGGACSCPQGWDLCSPQCVDVSSDDANCGACGAACIAGMHCFAGNCFGQPAKSIVFASNSYYEGGALGGLAGADSKCQGLALAAGLKGTVRAWLSDATIEATTRFPHWPTPYVLPDGATQVAAGWTVLTSGTLEHAIDQNESGGPMTTGNIPLGGYAVWTNTNPDGTRTSTQDCGGWAQTAAGITNGYTGSTSFSTSGWWTKNGSAPYNVLLCKWTARLFCIGQ
jgi:hypothetical protein